MDGWPQCSLACAKPRGDATEPRGTPARRPRLNPKNLQKRALKPHFFARAAIEEARNAQKSTRWLARDLPVDHRIVDCGIARQTEAGYEKTETVNGRVVNEKWDSASKRGSCGLLVGNRFMINAEGTVGDIAELRQAVATVGVDRLEQLTKN